MHWPGGASAGTVTAMSAASTSTNPRIIPGEIEVRRLAPSDDFDELTGLLHRAYRVQVEMGLSPLAGRQDAQTTRRRCSSGECYVAVLHGGGGSSNGERSGRGNGAPRSLAAPLVGTILFHEVEDAKSPPWFQRPEVNSFSQFAVDPDVQGLGIGRMLLDTAERRALACGARELGLSMAEPDTKLMEFYLKRGYRFIEHWQWPYTNYRSAILSRTLVI
jgi:GNAT superfamily N-acetyltransferase